MSFSFGTIAAVSRGRRRKGRETKKRKGKKRQRVADQGERKRKITSERPEQKEWMPWSGASGTIDSL